MLTDFTDWQPYKGASEGSGRSEKIWLISKDTEEIGLFKFPKSNATTEHISEALACDFAVLLGLSSARVEIGTYNGRIGSMSYLINDDKSETLIEGIYLINRVYPQYDPQKLFDKESGNYYCLDMILHSLDGISTLMDRDFRADLFKMMIFDYLIGNTDRHQSNWAILSSPDGLLFSSLYDNGSSLCCYLNEESIDEFLGKDQVRFDALVNSKSKSRIRICAKNKKEPTHLEVLNHLYKNYAEEVIPFLICISKNLTPATIRPILMKYVDADLLTLKRSRLIKKYLLKKVGFIQELLQKGGATE